MDRRANYWFTKSRSPSSTMTITTTAATVTSTSSPVPACGAAISLCTATHDRLLHAVMALSVIVGVLLTLSLILMLLLCFRLRHGKEGPIPVEEGGGTAKSVLNTGNATKGEEVVILPSPLEEGPPSSSKSPFEVGDATEENYALPRVPSVASQHSSPALSIAAISVDGFDQGQDEEFHPVVRAFVEEGNFTKEVVQHLKPVPPKAGTVIPDYNPVLDEARPETMDGYLRDYRIILIIDDSSSMGRHWNETREALSQIAEYALMYHSDAVNIRFFNSPDRKCGVRGTNQVMDIFRSVSPSGWTPTGRVLREVLDEQLDRLDNAHRNGSYSSQRPLDIIVLTDGVPNPDSLPAPVIEEAARRLKAAKHHQNWISIQFVQIGDDPDAEPTLLSLVDCANNNHMVDTISYSLYKDEGGGTLTPQILERIILGGLHPNLRSYYNQFRRIINERNSLAIY